jgi:nitrate reductase cytochrome c-type subunit
MKQQVTQNTIKLVALIIAASLILSVGMSASANAEEKKDKKKDAKKDSKKDKKKEVKKETKKKEVKKTETTKTETTPATPASTTQATVDPMQEKLAECKTKKNQREQYECEKALKASSGNSEFKAKATKTTIGPITFYSAEATVEKSSGKDIVNLRFLVENTGSKDNITLYCTGPAVCNYDVSDGTTTFKYASQDFTNGQIVLKPGASRTFNMLFGPAIGYGSYVDFKFDPSKQYVFNVKEPWGSGSIPLNLK